MKRLAVLVTAIVALTAAWYARVPRAEAWKVCAANVKTLSGAWEMYALDK